MFKKCESITIEYYTYVDYTSSMVDIISTLSYCTFLSEDIIASRSKNKIVVALSITKENFRVIEVEIF